MAHALDKFISHLEFLGYNIEEASAESITAKHTSKFNMVLKKLTPGVLVTAFFTKKQSAALADMILFANQLNEISFLGRFIADSDGDIRLEFLYMGDYDKQAFSAFLTLSEEDFQRFASHDKVSSLMA